VEPGNVAPVSLAVEPKEKEIIPPKKCASVKYAGISEDPNVRFRVSMEVRAVLK